MKGSLDTEFKVKLKNMILEECDREEITADELADDVELFSDESGLELDSVDGLQISMLLQRHFNLRLVDPKEFRRIVTTINHLADHLQPE
ncbi:acyl carrier protein [Aliivibrio sp. S4TY2]|uniref:Acyl carrier protein n=1 Tax=Aliivibrio finisterrensis TaxID=511998 RepID=A0A4Q5KPX0_9GAMM|nr:MULTISPECIES: acyl carrier protein [Aliivibrio]MDD9154638.1 acyl carrier protein [Aliivibrio sp. S4TY2]MDD9158999.1 acyl carrier protein [Aliivibrio sp. S4TY1]MDD9162641.1 acyl carrier protein [Aliivibrio sp. S4MY2]MDD9166998.1 acyl carrier protein [Aliivibrio sp. S4MY4]MDD9174708.1 acyl carrier protein [Aliivibrio sp. S3TY1]